MHQHGASQRASDGTSHGEVMLAASLLQLGSIVLLNAGFSLTDSPVTWLRDRAALDDGAETAAPVRFEIDAAAAASSTTP